MISASAETTERRSVLRRLDDILEALEQLNLRESSHLTERIRQSLSSHGIPFEDGAEIRVIIERVWRKQEDHMTAVRQDRRKTPSRRSSAHRPPGHDVIESIIRQSHQGPD
jgi:predicted DNA binding CopG/RHH family protein